jgi:hypothetical protein
VKEVDNANLGSKFGKNDTPYDIEVIIPLQEMSIEENPADGCK